MNDSGQPKGIPNLAARYEGANYTLSYGVEYDDPSSAAFGADTVGIVSEREGGIIAYAHLDNAGMIAAALNARGPDRE